VIVFLLNVYLVILFIIVKLKIVRFNLFWKISPVIVALLLLIGLFIPMGWGAPQGRALVVRNSVQIVSDVAGEVLDVPVRANAPLKAGDVLFTVDPTPYRATVQAIEAQLKLAQIRLAQMTQLYERDSGRAFDVQQRQSEVDQLSAQREGAQWNLDKTTVRAPADGYVTNVALRKGARVANLPLAPVMAFIDTSDTLIGVELAQIDARYVAPGQEVEITFKYLPGQVFTGKVETVLQAIASGQVRTSGLAVQSSGIEAAPFVARVRLDDADLAAHLPAGSTATAAIFTDRVKASHLVRKVLLRQTAIMNYVLPF
jgi:multidrug resistance efflux pump